MALKSFCGLKERVLACADFRTILVKPSYFTYFSPSDSQRLPSKQNPQPCHNSRRSALWSLSPRDKTGRCLGSHSAQHTPRHFYTLPRPETFSSASRDWLCGTIATAWNLDSQQDVFNLSFLNFFILKRHEMLWRKLFGIVSEWFTHMFHSQHTEESVGSVRLWVLSLETSTMPLLFCSVWREAPCFFFFFHPHTQTRIRLATFTHSSCKVFYFAVT